MISIRKSTTLMALVIFCMKLPVLIPGKLIAVKKVKKEMAIRVLFAAASGKTNIEYSLRTMQK